MRLVPVRWRRLHKPELTIVAAAGQFIVSEGASASRVHIETAELRPLTVTCSVGVALNEHQADTPEMILKRADVALYRAKREGRNRVVFDAA